MHRPIEHTRRCIQGLVHVQQGLSKKISDDVVSLLCSLFSNYDIIMAWLKEQRLITVPLITLIKVSIIRVAIIHGRSGAGRG